MTRIKSLDGWRAISIVLVIAGHLVNYRYGPAESHVALLASYCAQLGVKVFFVISGFLITSISLREEATTRWFLWLLMWPLAAISYAFVEKPFIRRGRRVTEKRTHSHTADELAADINPATPRASQ